MQCSSYTFQHFASVLPGLSPPCSGCKAKLAALCSGQRHLCQTLTQGWQLLLSPLRALLGSSFSSYSSGCTVLGQGMDAWKGNIETLGLFGALGTQESKSFFQVGRGSCFQSLKVWILFGDVSGFSLLSEAGCIGFMTLMELSVPVKGESKQIRIINLIAL